MFQNVIDSSYIVLMCACTYSYAQFVYSRDSNAALSRSPFHVEQVTSLEKVVIFVVTAIISPATSSGNERGTRNTGFKLFIQVTATIFAHDGNGRILRLCTRLGLARRLIFNRIGSACIEQFGRIVLVKCHAPGRKGRNSKRVSAAPRR